MKKFLSMLLALSVVFTYTFGAAGSVFAAEQTIAQRVEAAKSQVVKTFDAAYDTAVENLTDTLVGGDWTIEKAQLQLAAPSVKAAFYEELANEASYLKNHVKFTLTTDSTAQKGKTYYSRELGVYVEAKTKVNKTDVSKMYEKGSYEDDELTVSAINGILTRAMTTAVRDITDGQKNPEGMYLAIKKQFELDKAAALVKVKSVDTSAYSTTKQDSPCGTVGTTSYDVPKEYADALVAKAIKDINEVTLSTKAAIVAALKANSFTDGPFFTSIVNETNDTTPVILGTEKATTPVTYAYAINSNKYDILTKAKEEADKLEQEAAKEGLLATLKADVAAYKATYANADADTKKANDEFADAYKTAHTYLINATGSYTSATLSNSSVFDAAKKKLIIDNVAVAEQYIAEAKTIKAKLNDHGKPVYDSDKVDARLDKILQRVYSFASAEKFSPADYSADKFDYATDFYKANKKYAYAESLIDSDAMTFSGLVFLAPEWAKVMEAVNAFYDAVEKAVLTDDIEDAKTVMLAAIADIDNKDEVEDAIADTDEYRTQKSKINNYFNFVNDKDGDAALVNPFGTNSDELNVWYAAQGARKGTDLAGLYDKAIAEINSAKTAGELKAAVLAVKAQIEALPSAPTLADKATVLAADKAYNDVVGNPYSYLITNYSTLAGLKEIVKTAERAEIAVLLDKVDELTSTTVTVANKADIKAYKAAVESFNDDWAEKDKPNDVVKLLDTIKTAETTAIESAINALPAVEKITTADKAAVEAARDAYDAYVAEYTDVTAGTNAAEDLAAVYPTLVKAEAALAAAEKAEDAEQAIKDAEAKAEEALKAKEEAEKAKAEAEAAAKAEAEKAAAAEAAQKEAEEKAAAAEAAQKEAEEKAAAAEAAQKAAEEALKALETKLAVKDATARFVTTATKVTKTSITLQFKNDSGVAVDGYKVYMATSKNGTYKLVGTATTNTFTKKSLTAGKTYYFKVKAYTVVGKDTVYTQTSGKYAKKTAK